MSKIDAQVTRKMASLARLKLTDKEVQEFTPQLESVIQFIDQLSELDVSKVEPLLHPIERETLLRDDVVRYAPRSESGSSHVIESGLEVSNDSYLVPPIIG